MVALVIRCRVATEALWALRQRKECNASIKSVAEAKLGRRRISRCLRDFTEVVLRCSLLPQCCCVHAFHAVLFLCFVELRVPGDSITKNEQTFKTRILIWRSCRFRYVLLWVKRFYCALLRFTALWPIFWSAVEWNGDLKSTKHGHESEKKMCDLKSNRFIQLKEQ